MLFKKEKKNTKFSKTQKIFPKKIDLKNSNSQKFLIFENTKIQK